MTFTDICIITDDVLALVRFYEQVLQTRAEGDEIHSVITTDKLSFAIYSKDAARMDMGFDFTVYNGTGMISLGFDVDDTDKQYERLKKLDVEFITSPKNYPWGARFFHFRDPDGNIVAFRSYIVKKGELL